MSVEDYVRISRVRETIRLPKAPMDAANVRAVVTGIFGLQDGNSPEEAASADPREVQPSTPAMEGSGLSPLTDTDTLATGGKYSRFIGHSSNIHNAYC